jgi:hypothetical protein
MRYKGLLQQMEETSIYKKGSISLELIEEYIKDLSKPSEIGYKMATGKAGAIEMYVNIQKENKKYLGEILSDKEEKEIRDRLEKELKDGMYYFDSNNPLEFYKYLHYCI